MIVVIADDITGAAEMGGIALRYDLSVIVSDDLMESDKYEVIVIYTNTRSQTEQQAAETMASLSAKASKFKPSLFYKKTDSVLRGHVLAEMNAQMKAMNLTKGLLVPINPSSARVIRNGHYYINEQQIHDTSFAIDPEFPISSSKVEKMLGTNEIPVKVIRRNEQPIANGINVGEAESETDLEQWADFADNTFLLAGGGSFFNALLNKQYGARSAVHRTPAAVGPTCLISGTTFTKNVQRIRDHSTVVSYMPERIFNSTNIDGDEFDSWLQDVKRILQQHKKVIIAIDNRKSQKADPQSLGLKLAEIAKRIVERTEISELMIEGGATAYAITRKLGWHSFIPQQELAQGILRMQVVGGNEIHLTIKPGSYEWPAQWKFN